ncbi:MAG: sulfatase-like hydrolase/transferase, partial [Acidobacteriota bacterium]
MRAIALLVVLVIAKVVTLLGHSIPMSVWTPIAYFWQDVLLALIFFVVDRSIRRPWILWTVYALAVAYVAFNVAVSRVLSTPLTVQMMRAAGGALSDSVRHHLTLANVAAMLIVIASGVLLPVITARLSTKRRGALITAALMTVALGPMASSRVETIGLHRNALVALVASAFPRATVDASAGNNWEWRASPFEAGARDDALDHLVGSAAGRNVVLVLLESAGASYLRTYGAAADPMPNLTTLARRAVVFESAYTVYPESIRTLSSVLTARYSQAGQAPPSLAQSLKQAGYRTALFHSGRFMYLGMEDAVKDQGFDVLEDAGEIGGQRESSFGVDEQSTVRRMLVWIDSMPRRDRFLLTYLPIAGHHPYDTPQAGPFPEKEESDRYLNAMHYADSSLNELMEGMRSRGLAERTVFVIAG